MFFFSNSIHQYFALIIIDSIHLGQPTVFHMVTVLFECVNKLMRVECMNAWEILVSIFSAYEGLVCQYSNYHITIPFYFSLHPPTQAP